MANKIEIPNQWWARPYQQELFSYLFGSESPSFPESKRAACVWHRRAGKDSCSLNIMALASQMRVGTYWHMLPTLNQGRKVIWDGIDKYSRRMIDQAFPKPMRKAINNSEMRIELANGSIWQVVGSDNYDSLVGTNPMGVIFSEFSIADPSAWDYMRPILRENNGFAIFIYTPRGENHGYDLREMAKKNDSWFYSELTYRDTRDNEGNPILSEEDIEEERQAGMKEDMIEQEFMVSFNAGLEGAYYSKQLRKAKEEGRIGDFPWIEDQLVTTIWDLGIGDDNFIMFVQKDGAYYRVIKALKGSGISLREWVKTVKEQDYIYDAHYGPHDLEQREYSTGQTRIEFAESLGLQFNLVPKIPVDDGINAVRTFISECRFNEEECKPLLNSLRSYIRQFDERMKVFKDKPLHNWASHGADCCRYAAVIKNSIGNEMNYNGWSDWAMPVNY